MIRSELERSGLVISEADLWIAGTALASDGIIVTNNVREFSRVPGLAGAIIQINRNGSQSGPE
jgi:tRNA(fMet)-specific endonuclease VapC